MLKLLNTFLPFFGGEPFLEVSEMFAKNSVTIALACMLLLSVAGIGYSIDVFLDCTKYFPRWIMVDGMVAAIMPPVIDPVKVAVAIFSLIGVLESVALYLMFRNGDSGNGTT